MATSTKAPVLRDWPFLVCRWSRQLGHFSDLRLLNCPPRHDKREATGIFFIVSKLKNETLSETKTRPLVFYDGQIGTKTSSSCRGGSGQMSEHGADDSKQVFCFPVCEVKHLLLKYLKPYI